MLLIDFIYAADWARAAGNRVCCFADVNAKSLRFITERSLTVGTILELAQKHSGRTLLSFDLAIGIPSEFGSLSTSPPGSFLNWLQASSEKDMFWLASENANEWSQDRPFFAVPAGKGSLTAFHLTAGHDLRRSFDRSFNGKSPFIVSGIPGTVGSGTRSFWQELVELLHEDRSFAVWPFEGSLEEIFDQRKIAIGENYPAVSYAVVFAERLPSRRFRISKTRREVRAAAIALLTRTKWLLDHEITLPDLQCCIDSEDYFDALMVALAKVRCILEAPDLMETARSSRHLEGDILCSGAIDTNLKSTNFDEALVIDKMKSSTRETARTGAPISCPITGCSHVYANGRLGWDAHVGSLNKHKTWHPELTAAKHRVAQFRSEYPNFFM